MFFHDFLSLSLYTIHYRPFIELRPRLALPNTLCLQLFPTLAFRNLSSPLSYSSLLAGFSLSIQCCLDFSLLPACLFSSPRNLTFPHSTHGEPYFRNQRCSRWRPTFSEERPTSNPAREILLHLFLCFFSSPLQLNNHTHLASNMVTIKGLGLVGLPIVAIFTAYVLPTITILGLRREVLPVNNSKCVAVKGEFLT